MDFKAKKILVTGGTGFIGRNVVDALVRAGADVTVLTRNKYPDVVSKKFMQADLRSIDSLKACAKDCSGFDAAVFLAASIPIAGQPKEDLLTAKINTLDPLIHFLTAFGGNFSHLVFSSTIDVYGIPTKEDYGEDEDRKPETPYAVAKAASEDYVRFFCRKEGTPATILRFSQVYGPQEPIVRVIAYIKDAVDNKKNFKKSTDGNEKRRFIYVKDAARAVLNALQTKKDGIFNISGQEVVSLNELLALFMDSSPQKLSIVDSDNPARAFHNVPSIKRALNELGFEPTVSMKEGISLLFGGSEDGLS